MKKIMTAIAAVFLLTACNPATGPGNKEPANENKNDNIEQQNYRGNDVNDPNPRHEDRMNDRMNDRTNDRNDNNLNRSQYNDGHPSPNGNDDLGPNRNDTYPNDENLVE